MNLVLCAQLGRFFSSPLSKRLFFSVKLKTTVFDFENFSSLVVVMEASVALKMKKKQQKSTPFRPNEAEQTFYRKVGLVFALVAFLVVISLPVLLFTRTHQQHQQHHQQQPLQDKEEEWDESIHNEIWKLVVDKMQRKDQGGRNDGWGAWWRNKEEGEKEEEEKEGEEGEKDPWEAVWAKISKGKEQEEKQKQEVGKKQKHTRSRLISALRHHPQLKSRRK